MLSLDTGQLALLETGDYENHFQFWIEANDELAPPPNLTLQLLSEVTGDQDWLISGAYNMMVDNPVGSGTISLFRSRGADSLSPLVAASAHNINQGDNAPLIRPGKRFLLKTYHTAVGSGPPTGTPVWNEFFHGLIDDVDIAAGDLISLAVRDLGAIFMDKWIEEPAIYGEESGRLAELVMEDILTDNDLYNVVALPDGSPGFAIEPYVQEEMGVLDACRIIAMQIGWDVHARHGQVVLYDPKRSSPTVHQTFTPSMYKKITSLKLSRGDIRNAIELIYGPTRDVLYDENLESIQKYGRRWMRIVEDLTSNIDTLTEAENMMEAALSDLSEPFADQQVELPFMPHLEINDYLEFEPNGDHYDDEVTGAVVSVSHRFASEESSTSIQVRGNPITAHRNWQEGEPRETFVSPNDPSGPAPERAIWAKIVT